MRDYWTWTHSTLYFDIRMCDTMNETKQNETIHINNFVYIYSMSADLMAYCYNHDNNIKSDCIDGCLAQHLIQAWSPTNSPWAFSSDVCCAFIMFLSLLTFHIDFNSRSNRCIFFFSFNLMYHRVKIYFYTVSGQVCGARDARDQFQTVNKLVRIFDVI